MSRTSTHVMLGIGLAGLIAETIISHPALAVDKVKLFRVTTQGSEIVIGLSKDELAQLQAKDADGVAKVLAGHGSLGVWQYAERRGASGQPEEAPLKKLTLSASPDMRIEPFKPQMRVVPIAEQRMVEAIE